MATIGTLGMQVEAPDAVRIHFRLTKKSPPSLSIIRRVIAGTSCSALDWALQPAEPGGIHESLTQCRVDSHTRRDVNYRDARGRTCVGTYDRAPYHPQHAARSRCPQ